MEWKEVTLGEISSKIGDGLHGTPKYDDEGPYYFINGNNLNCGKIIIKDDTKRVGEDEFVKNQKELNEQTILVSINGTIGNVAKYNNELCILGKSACYINVIKEVDKEFIYYVLTSANFKRNITNEATGTTIKNVSLKQMREYKFNIPCNISDQRCIASILSSLDRKIELNNKINADLEEMAQAIFKNWFVDFEPFKDGKFVDSELGMIPEGWKVVTLDDLTSKFGTGLNPRKNFVLGHGNNYYVTIKNMGDNRIYLNDRCDKVDDEALAKINKRSKLQKGDLLFSGIGTIGRVAMVVEDPLNWNTSESVFNMHPIDSVSSEFIYLLLLSDIFQQYVRQNAQGGVQQGIRMASLKAFQLAIPDDLKFFDNLVKPIIAKVKSNDRENDRLSLLRDTLLPRLMSGELEVPE